MLIHLEITSWRGISFGAMHYYGNIIIHDPAFQKIPVMRKVTKSVQAELAAQDGETDYFTYEIGSETERWRSKESLRRAAIKWFKKNASIENSILIEGSSSTCEPQLIIYGKEPFKSAINALYERREELDWDNKEDEEELDKICDQWKTVIKPFTGATA